MFFNTSKVCLFGTIANILNIIVLTRKDMSKTPINTLLKWLAVADMFVMIEYIPFTIYMYIFPGKVSILIAIYLRKYINTICIVIHPVLRRRSERWMIFREIKYRMPYVFHFPLSEWQCFCNLYLFCRSHGFPIYLGGVFTVSHAFHTNFAHNIDIADSDFGAMEIYCNKVSMKGGSQRAL